MFDLTVLPFPRDFFATFLMHMFRDIYEFPVKIQHRRVNSGVSGGRWTLTRWPRSSMLSLTLEWITVAPFWSVHEGQ